MQYRDFKKTGEKISLMGMGTMRLPFNEKGGIDRPKAINMIRTAIDNGVNYVDTAYRYHNGESELVVAQALKGSYRERVFLADKMPCWLARSEEDVHSIFYEQLEKLETDYIDFYLLHNLTRPIWKITEKHNAMPFLIKMKEEGKIKHLGFSFHDDLDFFKELLDVYPWDFCQIQLNYMDKDFQAGVAGLKYAASKGIPVIIMEPVKGGRLSGKIPPQVQKLWDEFPVKRTPAQWALRWVADFPEVLTILNGTSDMSQVTENLATLSTALPNTLTEEEHALINKVSDEYNRLIPYSCTGCKYCMPCQKKINIPNIIDIRNGLALYGDIPGIRFSYNLEAPDRRGDACVGCKLCEEKCPQALPISQIMKETAEMLVK